jgi:hypothetical protein
MIRAASQRQTIPTRKLVIEVPRRHGDERPITLPFSHSWSAKAKLGMCLCTPCEVIVDASSGNHASESDVRDWSIGGK